MLKEQLKTQVIKQLAKRRRPRAGMHGLTLIEILVVVTIIGIIAGIVGVNVMGALDDANIDAAKVQIQEISNATDLFKMKVKRYPTTAEGLGILTKPPKGRKPVMNEIPQDPWDNEYVYVFPGQKNQGKFDLYSKGPDGVADREDDITNWSSRE